MKATECDSDSAMTSRTVSCFKQAFESVYGVVHAREQATSVPRRKLLYKQVRPRVPIGEGVCLAGMDVCQAEHA